MKRLGDKPLTQAEKNKRYYSTNELVLFATRIERMLSDKLMNKLKHEGKTKTEFLRKAIRDYLDD